MLRINRENIPTNGFGLLGLVEIAVEFDFGNSLGNASLGDGLQLVLHETSLQGPGSPQRFE